MKKIQTIALMMGIALTGTAGFSACSSSDVAEANPNVIIDENGQASVRPEFVISIPRTVVSQTRMANSITQADASIANFQGLDNIHLIPFASEPGAATAKNGDIIRLSNIPKQNGLSATPNINYKVWADQVVPVGTTNFLFYGKSIHQSAESAIISMYDKFKYGILNVSGIANNEFTNPGGISIQLVPINSNTERQQNSTAGKNIVALLNSLANTTASGAAAPNDSWSPNNTDQTLANLYTSFIQTTTASSNSIAIILSRLYFSLGHIQSTSCRPLADALKKKIEDVCDKAPISGQPVVLTSAYSNYPGDVGLPDGAARVRWNASGDASNGFTDITANYGNGNTIDITKYVYPPALWYYVNTPLKASNEKESKEYDNVKAGNWSGVIEEVYKDAASVVGDNTQSVALVNPVQYGVGRIETTLKMGAGPFYDRNGDVIATGKYTLTAILIGGQNSVNFDFTSKGSENQNQTIYDKIMSGDIAIEPNSNTDDVPNQTLALETKVDQEIYMALELVNGGEDFAGADGIIPAGGTFYLTAKLDPKLASNYKENSLLDKIVIQDHVTQVKVTIKNGKSKDDPDFDPDDPEGMGDATNGIPDLSSPGIEVGTSVDLNWRQGLILKPGI